MVRMLAMQFMYLKKGFPQISPILYVPQKLLALVGLHWAAYANPYAVIWTSSILRDGVSKPSLCEYYSKLHLDALK